MGRGVALAVQRRLVLDLLRRMGPQATDLLPPVWPLGAAEAAAVVKELEESGAVIVTWDPRLPGRRVARITEAGRRLLRELDERRMGAASAHPGVLGAAAD